MSIKLDGSWFPAYACLMFGKRIVSRPSNLKCRKVDGHFEFDRVFLCGPAPLSASQNVSVAFFDYEDEKMFTFIKSPDGVLKGNNVRVVPRKLDNDRNPSNA